MKNHVLLLIFFALSCSHHQYTGNGDTTVAISRFKINGATSYKLHFEKLKKEVISVSSRGASTILFAELNSLDLFSKNPKNIKKEISQLASYQDQYENDLKNLAKEYQINIIGGSTFVKVKDQIFNRAYFVSKTGKLQFQDKLYPTPWERKHHIQQSNDLKLFKTKDYSFVILICHDSEFPNLSVRLKKLKPQVIFVPSQTDSAFGRERVRATSRARSIEQMSYVLLNGGSGDPAEPWHTYTGGASFFWPQNKYFKLGGVSHWEGEGKPVIIKLDLKKLNKARSDQSQVYPIRDL